MKCKVIVIHDKGPGNRIRPSELVGHRHSGSGPTDQRRDLVLNSSDLLASVATGSLIA